jgi:Ca2+-binding EF-hand superfamily protein
MMVPNLCSPASERAQRVVVCAPQKEPGTRALDELHTLAGFFAELPFFRDLHFPLLQSGCCQHLVLQTQPAGQLVCSEGEVTPGRFFLILQGHLKVCQSAHSNQVVLGPPSAFPDAEKSLSAEAPHPTLGIRCDRTVEVQPHGGDERLRTTVYVRGFPSHWKVEQLFEVFQRFGSIVTIKLLSQMAAGSTVVGTTTSATVTFASVQQALSASHAQIPASVLGRPGQRSTKADGGGGGDGDGDGAGRPSNRLARVRMLLLLPPKRSATQEGMLWVQLLEEVPDGSQLIGASMGGSTASQGQNAAVDRQRSPAPHSRDTNDVLGTTGDCRATDPADAADVSLAVLHREAYLSVCFDVVHQVIDVLASPPRMRSPAQLTKVEQMFGTTPFFRRLSRSAMIRKSACRFLGIATIEPDTLLYEENQPRAAKTYIILTGHVKLSMDASDTPDELVGPGTSFGNEALTNHAGTRYVNTAVATERTVLATLERRDYMRICNTEDVQRVIDKFWKLASGKPEDSEGGPTQLAVDLKGYKQVYMRIAKVITTKQMFSAKELQKTMHQDWKEDLQLFGNPDTQTLNHEQYSDALYQLIDEWSNGVEAVKLYEQLLLLILENSTKLDRDGNLVLRPLRAVPCCFQALCDLRARWQSKVTQWQAASNIGKDDLGNVRNEAVEKTKSTFSQQGIFKSIAEASRTSSANSSGGRDMSAYLRQVFDSIDIDGSGSLDRDEVAQLSRNLGNELSPEELEAAMLEMDGDGGGEVDFEEFEDWYMNMLSSDDMIRVIFEQMDDDGSGTLEKAELGMLLAELGSPMSDVELDGVMRSIDVDNNGDVDVQEFSTWWRKYTSNELLSQTKVVEDPHAQYLLTTFNNADSDGNGAIDKRELTALMLALGEDPTPNDLNLMMAVMDENNDGDITFEEFARWFSCVVGMPEGHDAAGAATTLEMDKVCAVAASLRDVFGEEEATLSPRAVRAAFLHCANGTEPASISFADLRTWWTEVLARHDDAIVARVAKDEQLTHVVAKEAAAQTQELSTEAEPSEAGAPRGQTGPTIAHESDECEQSETSSSDDEHDSDEAVPAQCTAFSALPSAQYASRRLLKQLLGAAHRQKGPDNAAATIRRTPATLAVTVNSPHTPATLAPVRRSGTPSWDALRDAPRLALTSPDTADTLGGLLRPTTAPGWDHDHDGGGHLAARRPPGPLVAAALSRSLPSLGIVARRPLRRGGGGGAGGGGGGGGGGVRQQPLPLRHALLRSEGWLQQTLQRSEQARRQLRTPHTFPVHGQQPGPSSGAMDDADALSPSGSPAPTSPRGRRPVVLPRPGRGRGGVEGGGGSSSSEMAQLRGEVAMLRLRQQAGERFLEARLQRAGAALEEAAAARRAGLGGVAAQEAAAAAAVARGDAQPELPWAARAGRQPGPWRVDDHAVAMARQPPPPLAPSYTAIIAPSSQVHAGVADRIRRHGRLREQDEDHEYSLAPPGARNCVWAGLARAGTATS